MIEEVDKAIREVIEMLGKMVCVKWVGGSGTVVKSRDSYYLFVDERVNL